MDRDWMRERLEAFLVLCNLYNQSERSGGYKSTEETRKFTWQINTEVPTIRKIVSILDPELVKDIGPPGAMTGIGAARQAVQQALGILRDQEAWKTRLAPDAPSLIADQFHPYVWDAASAIWDTGNYKLAVQQATVSLSEHIAKKTGSSLRDRALVSQVFSPKRLDPGQVRLHMPGDKTSETWKSRQEGLHLIAQGAFAGIRNIATHTGDQWTEQVALEHLAVLSVVARWTDETEIVS
jgi:uncharacterized protein (TIGR02391 family)